MKQPSRPVTMSEGWVQGWVRFWFTPVNPIGFHVVRVLAGLLFLSWLLPFAGHLDSLFGRQGWFDKQAYADAARLPDGANLPIGWSALYLFDSNPQALAVVYWVSIAILVMFTLGVVPRVTAILTWIIFASFTANPAIYYDGDVLLRIIAFYLMIGCVLLGQRSTEQPLVCRLLGPMWFLRRFGGAWCGESRPSLGAGLALRLLQVHFAIVIVTSGLHKLQFGDWWGGFALWYPLYPPYETTLAQALAHAGYAELYMGVLSLAAYAMLAWQIGFPLYAWRPRWRPVLVGGALVGWIGMVFVFRLPLIGPAMLIGCLSFVSPAEWYWIFGLLTHVPGLRWLARWLPEEPAEDLPGIRRDEAGSPGKPEPRIVKAETGPRSQSIMSRTSGV
jgi:hypothetical protein